MTTKEKVDRKAETYTSFLRSLELLGIALEESTFKCDREQYFSTKEHRVSFAWTATHVPEANNPKHFSIRGQMIVSVTQSKSRDQLFDLRATFVLHIHADVLKPEFVNRFCDSEARLVVWPYLREYVTSMCGRAHIPPITLPLTGGKQ